MTKHDDFTTTITVDQPPEAVFAAITNVRAWWTGAITGPTDKLGAEFTYRYKDRHYSRHQVTELVPGERVAWAVLDSDLPFADRHEWNGTHITFDIATNGNKTEVRFTHAGLQPSRACYGDCSNAWTWLVGTNLRSLITTGKREAEAAAIETIAPPADKRKKDGLQPKC
jgi:uncharacterized protein YndB with AHSA1/START domain